MSTLAREQPRSDMRPGSSKRFSASVPTDCVKRLHPDNPKSKVSGNRDFSLPDAWDGDLRFHSRA
jgi:hypothetical protein